MKLSEYFAINGTATKAFADQLDVTPEAVRLWLSGSRMPRRGAMETIRRITGGLVTANDFLSPPDHPQEAA